MRKIYLDKLIKKHNKKDIMRKHIENSMPFEIEFIYGSNFKNTKNLRDFVEIIGETLGFSQRMINRLILISDELNNNAIEYGSDKKGENILRIKWFRIQDKRIFCMEVEDNGKGKSPKTALEMETMRAHRLRLGYFNHDSIRGRGLFLITVQLVDRLYFRNSEKGGLIAGVKISEKLF